jgi:hypothetical protein
MTDIPHGMKAKSIKHIIRTKIDEWLESIEDTELRKQVAKNVIVTGGAIASMLLGEDINDFDLYLRDHDIALAVAKHYLSKFNSVKKYGIECPLRLLDEDGRIKIVVQSAGVASESGSDKPYEYFEAAPENAEAYVGDVIDNPEQIEDTYHETEEKALGTGGKEKFRPIFLTTNAITLSHKIQIIIRFFGEPDKIHENYDFAHCTNYWTSWDNKLTLRPEALEALLARELRYVGSKYPICSMIRVRKFVSRGWRINAGQILKMAMQINSLDLKNLSVLEDQLTGVDTAYFLQLVELLKQKDPAQVDAAYLVEIIDRIF